MTERIVSSIINSNVFIVSSGNECVLIDAGAEVEKVKNVVGGKKVLGVFLTHGHYDHCFYVMDYIKEFGCKVYASKFAKEYLEEPDYNYSEGNFAVNDFSSFEFLGNGGKVKLGDLKIEYKQLGGHSKSDMMFKVGNDIFVGDVLLGRNMGRTDLYGGNKNEMEKSLNLLLKEDYQIMHAGHGIDLDKNSQDKVAMLWLKFLKRT